jgi:ADP-ribose pyrophosphatase YjhB (NUDIX family)
VIKHTIIPNISVDCVIFGFDMEKLNVIVIERELTDPDTGELVIKDHTLAGYHIYEDEELDAAASRILSDLTGLENIYLEQFYTFGQVNRVMSPKDRYWIRHVNLGFAERIITVGYFSLIDSTKVKLSETGKHARWFPVDEITDMELAFDHKQIYEMALEAL